MRRSVVRIYPNDCMPRRVRPQPKPVIPNEFVLRPAGPHISAAVGPVDSGGTVDLRQHRRPPAAKAITLAQAEAALAPVAHRATSVLALWATRLYPS
jgi:hypothetical protein